MSGALQIIGDQVRQMASLKEQSAALKSQAQKRKRKEKEREDADRKREGVVRLWKLKHDKVVEKLNNLQTVLRTRPNPTCALNRHHVPSTAATSSFPITSPLRGASPTAAPERGAVGR